jgi:hypothetical protein
MCLWSVPRKLCAREWRQAVDVDAGEEGRPATFQRDVPFQFIPTPTWMPRTNHKSTSQYMDPTVPPRSIESFTKLRGPLLIHRAVCESARAAALLLIPLAGLAAISPATECSGTYRDSGTAFDIEALLRRRSLNHPGTVRAHCRSANPSRRLAALIHWYIDLGLPDLAPRADRFLFREKGERCSCLTS